MNIFDYSIKPKVLFFADSASSKIMAKEYKKYVTEFDIDVSNDNWQDILNANKYDVLCHSNIALLTWKVGNIHDFIEKQHRLGTKVVLFDDNPCISVDSYRDFDAIFLHDIQEQEYFRQSGVVTVLIPTAVDLTIFGPDMPFQKRPMKIVTRKSDFLWQELKKNNIVGLEFVEVFDRHVDSRCLNEIYNQCKFFYGNIGFMEAAACGVIPFMKNKSILQNVIEFDDDQELIKKIIALKDDVDATLISQRLSKEMLSKDYKFLSHCWGQSLQKVILRKKAVYFT